MLDVDLGIKAQQSRIMLEGTLNRVSEILVRHLFVTLRSQERVGVPPIHVDAAAVDLLRTRTVSQ